MATTTSAVEEREAKASRSDGAAKIFTKAILVGLVDALLILAFARSATESWWPAAAFFGVVFVAVNYAYLTKKSLPLKYLLPGVVFLVVFQLYTMLYTAYASFTNYGTGHLGNKDAAISSIEQQSVIPVKGGQTYAVVPIVKDNTLSMLVTDPKTGDVSVGTNDGLDPAPDGDIQRAGEAVIGLKGYTSLNLGTMSASKDYTQQWANLKVPIDADNGSYLLKVSITQASEAKSGFVYDSDKDAMVSSTDGTIFKADEDQGNFIGPPTSQSPDGRYLTPGWKVSVGFSNFTDLFTDSDLRSRILPILVWTFVFAIFTTLLNFGLGLFLAMVLSEKRMRGQRIYRFLLIVPYGLPAILMVLVWKGMLNQDFGLVNQFLGSDIPWLTSTNLARLSVLMVNLWMGFPYFFLVCSGALTAIPADLKEAAYIDGAPGRYAFRTVVLPLLLVATAPLLVTTFAFNFNNYTLVKQLTDGGPFPGSFNDGGDSDLLINYTFRTAFGVSGTGANQQLGLASAIAMVIFVIVGAVSAYGFRLTRRLEEIAL